VTLTNSDNFHPASEVFPYHHPELTSDCDSQSGPCTVSHISVTELHYDLLDELDLGKTPIAATSMRVKLKSSQIVHKNAREPDADFQQLDMKLTECRDINQEVFDWAYSMADQSARDLYDSVGEKLVQEDDKNQTNGGLWIIQDLEWKENSDKTEMDNISVACILDEDQLVPIFKSMHYCKVLSPFRALEYIYVDSQYASGGYQAQQQAEQLADSDDDEMVQSMIKFLSQ